MTYIGRSLDMAMRHPYDRIGVSHVKEHAAILKSNSAFERFSNRTLGHLTAHSAIVQLPKGTVVFKAGDPVEAMYVVLSGRCQSWVLLPDGSHHIMGIYAPGDIFGERALVSSACHSSTVKVITDCALLRIAAEDVERVFKRTPKLARDLVLRLVDQLNVHRQERQRPDLGRVVALTRISERVRGAVVGENLAEALRVETGGSVVFLHVAPQDGSATLAEWNRVVPLPPGDNEVLARLQLNAVNEPHSVESVAPLVGELSSRFRYVVILLDLDVPLGVVTECIEQADVAYLLFAQTSEDYYKVNLLTRHLHDVPVSETEVFPVVCLEYAERAESFETLQGRIGCDVRRVIHGLPRDAGTDERRHYAQSRAGRFSSHIRRLAREVGRCQIGLALSSGGAKGFAYVSIIQVLEENGIEVDVVAGTSMGAYVGALWAYGLSGKEMEPLALHMAKPGALLRLIDPAIPPRRGFMRGNKIRKMLEQSIGDAHFSDMVRQLRIVATDLNTLERVVYDSGEVAPCVQGSIAMPGVFVPVDLKGRTVIDGGIADSLPVDVLIEMGIERIIAVNTIPSPEDMRSRLEMGREAAALPRKHLKAIASIGQVVNYFAPGNILDIMMRGIHGAQTRLAEGSCKQADVVLRPVSPIGKWNDFAHAAMYLELGRRVAEDHLDELKKLAKRGVS
jgi:NTE family protein